MSTTVLSKHQLLTLPAIWLFAIFIAGWVSKSWIVGQLGMVTIAQASEDKKEIEDKIVILSATVDEHVQEFKFANAFQMERAYQEDLEKHLTENLQTPAWLAQKRKLESKVFTAGEYKTCVLENKPKTVCDLLQRQLWQ